MPVFMKYDGIDGDVDTKGFEKWIELSSWQWGIGRGITSATSGGADREATTPSVSEMVVTKRTDGASVNFMRASLGLAPAGEGKDVQISFVQTDQGQPEPYMEFKLTNCLVSGWSLSSGGDRPTESLTLNFTAVEFKNTGMGAANETGNPDIGQYDLTSQTGS